MERLGELFELLAHRALFDLLAPLATMFAGLPPSSSDLTERKGVVPAFPPAHSSPLVLAALARFCWEIGGANIEKSAAVVVARRGRTPLLSPFHIARRLARSSRTAARQSGSLRWRAISISDCSLRSLRFAL
jgi:hypothetical protein